MHVRSIGQYEPPVEESVAAVEVRFHPNTNVGPQPDMRGSLQVPEPSSSALLARSAPTRHGEDYQLLEANEHIGAGAGECAVIDSLRCVL